MEDRIVLDGRGRLGSAVAAHVRRGDAVAGGGERSDLMTPRAPALRPAVAEDDERSLARHRDPHPQAVRGERLEPCFDVHRIENPVTVRRAAAVTTFP